MVSVVCTYSIEIRVFTTVWAFRTSSKSNFLLLGNYIGSKLYIYNNIQLQLVQYNVAEWCALINRK